METFKISKDKILYINIEFILKSSYDINSLDEKSYLIIKEELKKYDISGINLIIIDFKNVDVPFISIIDESDHKKSQLYFAFNDFIINSKKDIIFLNTLMNVSIHLIEKDFPNIDNVFIISYEENNKIIRCCNVKIAITEDTFQKRWELIDNFNFLNSSINLFEFVDFLISNKIKYHLLEKGCKQLISDENKEEHILKSTSVHVNMYINIKPLIENYKTFNEICFYISKRIIDKLGYPDYIIASSKNSESIASGVLRYLKDSDLIIINQVSPITAYNSYTNILSIRPNSRCAIIEDFHCMGTEIKVVKGILWCQGINVKSDVYTFPVASTSVYDGSKYGFEYHKIFPLFKLDSEFKYLIFTNNSCPICNNINCDHKKNFCIYET